MTRELCCRDTTFLVCESRERSLLQEEIEALSAHLKWCMRCQAAREQFEILFSSVTRYLRGDLTEGTSA